MSTLHITEFSGLQTTPFRGEITAAVVPPLADQTVAISGTSTKSNAVNAGTRLVRISVNANCYLAFGPDPTATSDMMPMDAGAVEYFQVLMGSECKIAVIAGA